MYGFEKVDLVVLGIKILCVKFDCSRPIIAEDTVSKVAHLGQCTVQLQINAISVSGRSSSL